MGRSSFLKQRTNEDDDLTRLFFFSYFCHHVGENFARRNRISLTRIRGEECLAIDWDAWRIICINCSTRQRDIGICPSCSLISRVNESLVFLEVHVVRERRQPALSHSVDASEREEKRTGFERRAIEVGPFPNVILVNRILIFATGVVYQPLRFDCSSKFLDS